MFINKNWSIKKEGNMHKIKSFDLGSIALYSFLMYSIFGTIINLVIALIYNLLSKKLGGLKIELVES